MAGACSKCMLKHHKHAKMLFILQLYCFDAFSMLNEQPRPIFTNHMVNSGKEVERQRSRFKSSYHNKKTAKLCQLLSYTLTSYTRYTLRTTCMTLYTINVFLRSKGFLSFIYLGPACRQKYRYVTSMVTSGPGLSDSSHGFVRRSVHIQ